MGGKLPSPGAFAGRITSPTAVSSAPRISPISAESPGPLSSVTQPSSSTESVRTVRAGLTPSTANQPLRTPSYPFPYVPGTPRAWSPAFHQPFTVLSPTTSAEPSSTPGDSTISAASTPGPTFSPFAPAGAIPVSPSDPLYPNPNLYDVVLQLNAEPGLESWWSTVTKILHDSYLADRVSLALPADSNDIENVPWGQKATFNVSGHDEGAEPAINTTQLLTPSIDERLSSSLHSASKTKKPNILHARPGLESRHSYSGAGIPPKDPESKRLDGRNPDTPVRPSMPLRALTQMPSSLRNETFAQSPRLAHLQEIRHASMSDPEFSSVGGDRQFIPHMSVFQVLRGLDAEFEGLIDTSGINRVLERGNMVTLTRDYVPEQQRQVQTPRPTAAPAPPTTEQDTAKRAQTKSSLPFRSIFPISEPSGPRRGSLYEEYEQQPPSPWSQSPAPSPAIQADPDENPFFAEQDSVESSFNPSAASPDYSNLQAIEAIGVDKASTVIHLPLIHPTLSGYLPPSGDDSRPTSATSTPDTRRDDTASIYKKERRAPIAVISIMSPAVPYPANLTQSLKMLGPHLAASFAIAQQFSAMQTQALGIRHRRGMSGRNMGPTLLPLHPSNLDSLIDGDFDDTAASISGSITSPSDYSGRSKHSPGSSIAGTPGWDPTTQTHYVGRHTSEGQSAEGEMGGYFDKRRGNMPRSTSNASVGTPPPGTPSKGGPKSPGLENRSASKKLGYEDDRERRLRAHAVPKPEKSPLRLVAGRDRSPPRIGELPSPHQTGSRQSGSTDTQTENADRLHSVLHSYGADFGASFQSLPVATNPRSPNTARSGAHTRTSSTDDPDMPPPPSERLLRTIIDSLPVQIFTASPVTGEISWMNSKFLVYRGQTCRQVLKDPWNSIHPEDRPSYMEQWSRSLRTGQQLQQKVRLQRFDGNYRWFYVRAAPLRDKRQSIVHWIGTNMDFHEQHIAELNSSRQQETAASEAKYRALANSSPQVVFTVNRSKGITFCNSQWMSYSGQTEAQALGLGFVERVHPDDIVKCRLPNFDDGSSIATNVPTSVPSGPMRSFSASQSSSSGSSDTEKGPSSPLHSPPSAQLPQRKLSELATTGILKVSRDADGKASYSTEVRLKSKEGEYRWHLVRVLLADNSLRIHDDEETWYGTCTDINDHKALERDLKETMDEKSRFLSNMSHEIRTPLNGITGMVNFLIDSNLSEEQMEHVNIIRASTEGLRGLINDILDLSKAEAGMIQLNLDWFYVRSLIEEVNDLTSAMAIDKGLELNYIVEVDVPAQIKGDRFRIRQILLNVIGNAIKFTQTGEVFVRCSVLADNESQLKPDELMIQFEVIDTGRGFTEKEAQYLFKRFSQIDGSSTRQHGGTGLGLVISRQLAQLHGGDMSAKGYPGKGATFVFFIKSTLPNDVDMPPPDLLTPRTPALPPPSATTIKPYSVASKALPSLTGRVLQSSPLTMDVVASPSPPVASNVPKSSPSFSLSSSGSISSIRTTRTSVRSESSSASSYVPEVAMPDRPPVELTMPSERSGQVTDVTPASVSSESTSKGTSTPVMSPPMYSILVVCPLKYSRAATVQHIDMILPKNIPHKITARESLLECQRMIGGDDAVKFSHVVLVVQSVSEIIAFMDQVLNSGDHSTTQLIVITDLNHRRQIMEAAPKFDYERLAMDRRLRFIFKPLKPSKFGVIFDPQKEREMSTDRNQDSAQQVALTQKQLYDEMTKRLGSKGKRVLLVEDNRVNQMVLLKFLGKVSIPVETVLDGAQCTEKIYSKPHGYYSIILCDLHMPNKDGYQTCKEIRKWEKKNKYPYLPIIALSANVLGDVYTKCVEAGFNSYVTKPVDFKELSTVMLTFLDPSDPNRPIEFMKPKKK
ncbi:hypothetical protein K461DRAFT_220483 [Myriangium duriaei CBS 260.36]|uniref:histidine kinase n=1 Tax=Myriangium duriaei CBS 260.36 TaxID=1168546 RepID=A0A9P4J9S3_9PEZI|nr:hypothetical protein K461DRAFT_220483 [Myriangium duriaei CBS 260.36]